jgi:hypothetical protein
MSEWEQLVAHFFMRTISGVLALVIGTTLSYYLVIIHYLRWLEHYKEMLRVYKELDKRCAEMSVHVEILLDEHWDSMTPFAEKREEFVQHVKGADRLFMSSGVKRRCEEVVSSFEELSLDRYPRPPAVARYPSSGLANVGATLRALRGLLEDEIHTTHWAVSPQVVRCWSRVKKKLSWEHRS